MTDYYDELKLSSSLGTTELYQELSKLESLWRRREVTNPEKAAKMIALIVEAQKKFKDEQSRRDYDLQLDQSKRKFKQLDPNAERLQSFMEWRNKAVSFYDEKQYDLAKAALEKAFSYMPIDYEDSLFFNQAALIYVDNNDCNAAMDYINKAIIIDGDTPDYYLTKGLVFNTLADGQYVNFSDKQTFREKSEKMFLKAYELAARKNISGVHANAAGALALYYNLINDEARAETFAQEAVQYGDPWGNGQKVLDNIKRAQQEQRRREDEAREKAEQEQRNREKMGDLKIIVKGSINPLACADGSYFQFTIDGTPCKKLTITGGESSTIITLPSGAHKVSVQVYGYNNHMCTEPPTWSTLGHDFYIKAKAKTIMVVKRPALWSQPKISFL